MTHKNEYIWAFIGRFLPLLIYLVTTMVLARYLSPDDFGKVGALSVFFMVANTLMDAGLGGSLVKEPNLTKVDCSTILIFNFVASIILYALIFLFSSAIESYFESPGLSMVVRVLCLIFVINSLGLVPRSLLQRNLKFRHLTIINIVSVFVAALTSVILAIYQFGVYALVAYQIVCAAMTVILSIKVSGFIFSLQFSRNSLFRLMPFGVYTTLTSAIDAIYENLITFLFGKYLNMQQAGFLYQAKRLEEVPSQSVVQTISNVAFPVLTKIRTNANEFANECNATFKNVLLMVLPVLFTLSVFSEPTMVLVFGDQWKPAAPYLSLLIYAAIFHMAETLNRTFIKSTTQVNLLFKYTMIKRVLGIGVIFICLFIEPRIVLYGYIVSTFIGYVLNVHLLSKISEMTISKQLSSFGLVLLPNVIYFLFMSLLTNCVDALYLQLAFCLLSLFVYYFVILRIYGINILLQLSSLYNKLCVRRVVQDVE